MSKVFLTTFVLIDFTLFFTRLILISLNRTSYRFSPSSSTMKLIDIDPYRIVFGLLRRKFSRVKMLTVDNSINRTKRINIVDQIDVKINLSPFSLGETLISDFPDTREISISAKLYGIISQVVPEQIWRKFTRERLEICREETKK